MQALDPKQKKEIVQATLEASGTTGFRAVSEGVFSVRVTDEKTFEKDFMRNLAPCMNKYLVEHKLEPSQYNRTLTYSMSDKNKEFTISF